MHGIEVREFGAGLLVELSGEFDVFCSEELRWALDDASSYQRPVRLDLSGITFLDLCSARELAFRSTLGPNRPTFVLPSPQVMATMSALGLEGWPDIPSGVGREGRGRVFSGIS